MSACSLEDLRSCMFGLGRSASHHKEAVAASRRAGLITMTFVLDSGTSYLPGPRLTCFPFVKLVGMDHDVVQLKSSSIPSLPGWMSKPLE